MKLPNYVFIGPYEFDIEYVDRLIDGTDKLNGQISYNSALIEIEANVSDQVKRAAIIHEILHGCSVFTNADLKEEQVELVAYQLTEVLERNPQLLEMFVAPV